jgi:argininosuccinate lyase
MAKLWQKNYSIDSLMESFTVRNDYILDQELVISDCLGSIAHAKGLEKIGILSAEECENLLSGLKEIVALRKANNFPITLSDEDCHTAIEGYLTKMLGDTGKKIHTGRSRNDQVQTALRIYMREATLRLAFESAELAKKLFVFAKEYEGVPMPGRTHMQIAMPSSVGLWAASFGEEILDISRYALSFYNTVDQSPLGSAASYGVPIPLDREYTAALMGFSRVQHNVLYANNSRGKFEAMFLDLCSYVALTISKLSQDLILFSLPEFGYFSLPKELTTGSSIMPQKKNPDGLELARSRTALVLAEAEKSKSIIKALPSGYNRDFQDTKEPFLNGFKATMELIRIIERMMDGLEVHPDRLVAACTPELYATDDVFEKIMKGGNFRDSYRDVGLNLDKVVSHDPYEALKKRTSTGTAGALGLDDDIADSDKVIGEAEKIHSGLEAVYSILDPGLESVICW